MLIMKILFLLMLSFLLMGISVYATEAEPILILNMANTPNKLPRTYRYTGDPYLIKTGEAPTRKGLEKLNIAGSSQFSEEGLKTVLEKLQWPQKMIVVDLRQESHGFLNGAAISWFSHRDWNNKGKTDSEALADQTARLKQLSEMKTVIVTKLLSRTLDGGIAKKSEQLYIVDRVADEPEVVAAHHLGYFRLFNTDHVPPRDAEVNKFIAILKENPGTLLYLHCSAGKGRTTVFMLMADMFYNAKELSFEEIVARQYYLGGTNILDLKGKEDWRYPYKMQRVEFLKKFYAYARNNQDNFTTPFVQ